MASKRKKSRPKEKKKGGRSADAAVEVREPESAADEEEAPPPKQKAKKQSKTKKQQKTTKQQKKKKSRKAKKSASKSEPKAKKAPSDSGAEAEAAPTEPQTRTPPEAAAPPSSGGEPAVPREEDGTARSGDEINAHDLDDVLDESETEDVDRLIAAAAGDATAGAPASRGDAPAGPPAAPGDPPADAPAAARTTEPEPVPADSAPVALDDAGPGRAEPERQTIAGETEPGPPSDAVEDADELDLGPTSTPEHRARILAAALAHAEMQEARYRVPTARGTVARLKTGLAFTFLALAGLLAVAPPSIIVPEPPPSLTPAERLQGVRLALLLQAEQIEAFRARVERLPRSLDELSTRVPGVRFVRSSNRLYQLVAYMPDGRAVVYDSSAPGPEFRALEPSWRSGGGP